MEVKPGYKQTEVGIVPNDWDICPVKDKGEVITGKALAAYAPGPQRPYLRTKNVFDGRIDIRDVLSMPMTDEQFERFRLRQGDVLLNEGQSINLVGRCALYGNEYPFPCAIQNQLLRFRAREGVSDVFASYLFRHCQHTGVFSRIALQTTSIAHLGGARLERLRLAWPSTYAEQQAIAQALTDVDGLIQSLERLIAKKRDLKQAAMQQLLTGQTRLPGFSGTWRSAQLGSCLKEPPSYGINAPAVPYSGSLPAYIRITDISDDGRFSPKPPVSVDSPQADRYRLNDGDVLLARTGASVGKSYLYRNSDGPLVYAGFLIRVTPNPDLLHSGYLAGWLLTEPYKRWVRVMSMRSGQPGINGQEYASLELPLPPEKEQAAIAEVLSDMDTEITALEARLAKTRDLKQGMMQELLTGRTRLV
jgi:type I restriction enzyme S subunit